MSGWLGRALSRYLEGERPAAQPYVSQDFEALCRTLRVGDVLLVEGRARVSTAIKYLTQSTWSHAAICVRDRRGGGECELVEVTLAEGCHRVPLSKYRGYNTRICRAAALGDDERAAVAAFAESRIGLTYDTRNIIDLARYLLPTPPVPVRWRRQMLAFGSGDPTRAICSSLIAQAFQSVRYPILPTIRMLRASGGTRHQRQEIWHIRHHSLFVPRDFDLSPYFAVIKPTLEVGFDHRRIQWAQSDPQAPADGIGAVDAGPEAGASGKIMG
ncbi:MAG: hypothetical protein Kow0013_06890 [Pararhodobacter sp.]